MLNRLFRLFGITSLKGRLFFIFLSFIILAVILASIPFVFFGKQHKKDDAYLTTEKSINMEQVAIEYWLDEKKIEIKSLSELPSVRNSNTLEMEEVFNVFHSNNNEFRNIVYINKEGKTEINTSGQIGNDLSDQIYFKEAKNGNSWITDVLMESDHSPTLIIVISSPIYDDRGNFQGLVAGSISLATITDVMNQFRDSSRESYIIDRNGRYITESRQGQIGEYMDSEIKEAALKGETLTDFYPNPNGEMVLGHYRWIHDGQWLLIAEIAKSEIFKPFYLMASLFSIVILVVSIIGYRMMMLFTNQVVAPIQHVLTGTRNIGQGNFDYRIESYDDKEISQEFQQLHKDFNSMSSMIEDYVASIGESKDQFQTILDNSSDMITILDLSGNYLYVSPAGKEILQYDDSEVIGFNSYEFIHPDDKEAIRKKHETLLENGVVVSTYRVRRKDGEFIWFETSIKMIQGKDAKRPQLLAIARNITERKRLEQNLIESNKILHELSTKDGLTGVWNRRTFDERIKIEWNVAQSSSTPLSLIMLDIDYFKGFNDMYGHQRGDDCLIKVASKVRDSVKRNGDMVFRFGGEEFCILLPKTDQKGAKVVAENIRKAVASLKILHLGSQIEHYLTISVGVNTVVPTESQDLDQFIAGADKALYQAKRNGRNRVEIYETENIVKS